MIEDATAGDGEHVKVAYFDDQMQACDKADASLIKVFFDDGRIRWLHAKKPPPPDDSDDDEGEDIGAEDLAESNWSSPHFV